MHKLSEILKKSKRGSVRQGYDYHLLTSMWDEILDEKIAMRAHPIKITRDKLYVSVTESIWAQQLKLLAPRIINKINKKIGKDKVRQICFKVMPREEEKKEEIKRGKPYFSKEDELFIEKFFKKNEVGNEKLEKIFVKDYKSRKKKLSDGYKECKQCSYLYAGLDDFCPKCLQDMKHDKMKKIIKDIERTPWVRAEEMGFYDEDSQELFLMCKSILVREKQFRLEDGVAFKKVIDDRDKKFLRRIAQEYVELKTGFKPFEINNEVMKNNLPERLYKQLFDERGN